MGSIAKTGLSAVTTSVTAVSAALGGIGILAAKTGMEFDSSMSQVAATLGLTAMDIQNNVNGAGDTFDMLRAKAKEMGAETNFSATEAAEGLNILAMSGYDANQSIAMIEDVLHLSAAGAMDMGSAAGYVAGAMKGFADNTKPAAYYADLMAKGATLANTNVQQLGEAMSSGAASAASYGQSADSMTVALLRLAEQGEVGSAAGTALAAAMKNLYTPTDQAKSVLSELGVAAYDSSGKARDFNTVVNELDNALSGYTAEQQAAYKQTIFGIQGLDAYNKMVVTTKDKQEEWTKALAESAGEAAKQYNTMTDNLQGDLDIFKSAVSGLQISLSDELMPEIRNAVQTGTGYLNELQSAFNNGGISGAVGALGSIFADITTQIAGAAPGMIDAAVSLINNFISGISGSLPQLAESAVQIGESLLTAFLDIFPQIISMGSQLVVDFAQGAVQALPTLVEKGVEMVQTICTAVTSALPQLIPAAVDIIMSLAQSLVDNLPMLLEAGLQLVQGLVQGLMNAIPVLVEALPEIIESLVSGLISCVGQLVAGAIQLVVALVTHIPEIIAGLIAAIPDIIVAIIDGIINGLGSFVEAGGQIIDALWQGIQDMWNFLVKWFTEVIPNLITEIWTCFSELPGKVGEWLTTTLNNVISWGATLWDKAVKAGSDFVNGIVNFVKTLPQNIWNWLQNAISKVTSFVTTFGQKALEAGKNFFNNIVNTVKEIPGKMLSIGKNIVSGIWNGISGAAGWLWDQICGFCSGIVDNIKGFFGIHSPSRLMAKEIGRFLPPGITEGFEQALPEATDQMQNGLDGLVNDLTPPEIPIDIMAQIKNSGVLDEIPIALQVSQASIVARAVSAPSTNVPPPPPEPIDYEKLAAVMSKVKLSPVVELDGKKVSKETTPYTDQNMGTRISLEKRYA